MVGSRWMTMVMVMVTAAACGDDGVVGDADGDGDGDGSSGLSSASIGSEESASNSADDDDDDDDDASDASDASGTGADSVADTGTSDCAAETFSDLPGVALDVATGGCVYSLADAQAGVLTTYTLAVQDALTDVDSGTECYRTPVGSVHVSWRVYSEELVHCNCDVGLCAPYTPMPTALPSGDQEGEFIWHGFEWAGESDTNVPFGDPFPPGEYIVEVHATGTWSDPASGTTPFEMWARQPVTLVP